jgi:Rieske Fe-S protein
MTDRLSDLPTELPVGRLAVRGPSRRRVLVTGGVIVAAAAATAACGSSGPSGTGAAPGPADSTDTGRGASIPTADIPVGGGEILTDQKVVITQPTAGTFKAFTAVCTHQGCLVASIVDAMIVCPCHGSTYSISDGSVTGGPAPAPLAPVPLTVSGDTITLT